MSAHAADGLGQCDGDIDFLWCSSAWSAVTASKTCRILIGGTKQCREEVIQIGAPTQRIADIVADALATASALLLLFSPLYADGELKLKLLFSCVSLTLSLCIIQALLVSLTTNLAGAPRYALLSTLATLCLLLVQARHLAGFADWLNPGLLLLVAITALALPQPRPN